MPLPRTAPGPGWPPLSLGSALVCQESCLFPEVVSGQASALGWEGRAEEWDGETQPWGAGQVPVSH